MDKNEVNIKEYKEIVDREVDKLANMLHTFIGDYLKKELKFNKFSPEILILSITTQLNDTILKLTNSPEESYDKLIAMFLELKQIRKDKIRQNYLH